MPRANKSCSCLGCPAHHGGCPEVVPAGTGRCEDCSRAADRARGSAAQRGYGGAGHRAFRRAVLARDPICVIGDCLQPSRHADHHWIPPGHTRPWGRRELVEAGLNPNDPKYGRGLCASHHSQETAANPSQRGGWNA